MPFRPSTAHCSSVQRAVAALRFSARNPGSAQTVGHKEVLFAKCSLKCIALNWGSSFKCKTDVFSSISASWYICTSLLWLCSIASSVLHSSRLPGLLPVRGNLHGGERREGEESAGETSAVEAASGLCLAAGPFPRLAGCPSEPVAACKTN